ncbi:hypothetical protein [Kineococcus aurantiacus]|uniref:Glycosyl transferase family 2 n=1 Tax=Kineococcus aurantiacus TaxID=37633 RepID=A0A7Y9DKC0_9ACTN|nr:hypothetical protein [Kineococcus aurantiacus]NYD22165.1 hypothetical protein [Kineococcus aurantiacus]
MLIHVVYRSHGGENSKARPNWYSKLVGLQSFCRAVQTLTAQRPAAGPEVVFLNDGPLPADRAALMAAWGDPVTITAGSNRRSYLTGLSLARRRGWADDDLVLLAEDDYLWRPEALVSLLDAASDPRSARADYFAPYGEPVPDDGRPARWAPLESTTSTFAVRVRALRQDERLLQLCAYSGGDFDYASCLTLQGRRRFGLRELFDHHAEDGGSSPLRALARGVYLTGMRTAVDLRSLRRPSRRRVLLGAQPALATHMEEGWISPGPWEQVARDAHDL